MKRQEYLRIVSQGDSLALVYEFYKQEGSKKGYNLIDYNTFITAFQMWHSMTRLGEFVLKSVEEFYKRRFQPMELVNKNNQTVKFY